MHQPQPPIVVTLTLNPALDVSTSVDSIEPWHKLRCDDPQMDPGGGGVNVARVVHALGGSSIAVAALGGHVGSQVATSLRRHGVGLRRIRTRSGTRQNFSVVERSTGKQFRFVEHGDSLTSAEWHRCIDATVDAARGAACVVASGSVPEGVPANIYALLADRLLPMGVPLIVDTSGPALAAALAARIALVKPSVNELRSLVNRDLDGIAEIERATREILERSRCDAIAVSIGEEGAVLVERNGPSTFVRAPTVEVLSTIGAGDSMVGGIAYSLACGRSLAEAVRCGVAAGSAAVLNSGTGLCRVADVDRLLPATLTRQITAS